MRGLLIVAGAALMAGTAAGAQQPPVGYRAANGLIYLGEYNSRDDFETGWLDSNTIRSGTDQIGRRQYKEGWVTWLKNDGSRSLTLYRFRCENRTVTVASMTEYDSSNRVSYAYNQDEFILQYQPATPGSAGFNVMRYVCGS